MSKAKAKPEPVRLQEIVDELQEITTLLESNEVAIEEATTAYERGIKLLDHAQQHLESIEQRVSVLSDDGLGELKAQSGQTSE